MSATPDPGAAPPSLADAGFPAELPQDGAQPWEASPRSTTALNPGSEFTAGRDWFMASATGTSENGEAARLESTAGNSVYGIWRLSSAAEPGSLSLDVNRLDDGSARASNYYVGLANYGTGRWEWQGPFDDGRICLGTAALLGAGDSYLSAPGHVFVSVLASGGARLDVVGIGLTELDGADGTAPPQVTGLTASPGSGGLELQWLPVIADDLAGYQVYYANSSFNNPDSAGVRRSSFLENSTRFLLDGLSGDTYVRIAAIDNSGNRGPLSAAVNGEVLPGSPPQLLVETDTPSGGLGSPAMLSASGADSYDIDTDGDGVFDITGSSSGAASIDTNSSGLIRPRVRGSSDGGEAVALGAVSLIISGNSRPLASATASPQSGPAPLSVTFSGMAEDGEDAPAQLHYTWDFDGDGLYESGTDSLTPPAQEYMTAGIHNVKFRVQDSQGASDVDTISVLVTSGSGPNSPPTAVLSADRTSGHAPFTVQLDASASSDGDGSIVWYEWDFNGDGAYEAAGPAPVASHTFALRGCYRASLRVTDDEGAHAIAELPLAFPSPWGQFNGESMGDRRSLFTGPQTNSIYWSVPLAGQALACPVISPNGDIIMCDLGKHAWSFHPDGSLRWNHDFGQQMQSSPAVSSNGVAYFGVDVDNLLYAYNANESERWNYGSGFQILSSPTLGRDDTIYFGDNGSQFSAVDPSGNYLWNFPVGDVIQSWARVGPDGCIYFGCHDGKLYALWPDGTLRWDFPTGDIVTASPAIAPDGTVYVASQDHNLYALSPDGSQKWFFATGDVIWSSPAIGEDGSIYLGSFDNSFYAINPDGSEHWSLDTGADVVSSPLLDANGTIYFGGYDSKVHALNPDGSELWSRNTSSPILGSPSLNSDGALYIVDGLGTLYAFRDP